jgi:hypothetical protein
MDHDLTVPRILFIPDRFADYRMWSTISDQLEGRAEVMHFDQHEQMPWTNPDGGFLAAVRRLAEGQPFSIVVAAGQAARFGFAVAEAGLACSVVLFYPSPDCLLAEIPDVDYAELLKPYVPAISAVRDGDVAQLRDVLVQAARDAAGPDADPRELQTLTDMLTDHAAELLTELQATQAAADADSMPPDPPWLRQPWIGRLATLTVPVTAVITPGNTAVADVIAGRAQHGEVVILPQLAPAALPSGSAEVILRILDR